MEHLFGILKKMLEYIRLLEKEKSQQKVLFAFTRRVQKWSNTGKWRGIYKSGTIPQITAVFDALLRAPFELPSPPVLVVTFRQ